MSLEKGPHTNKCVGVVMIERVWFLAGQLLVLCGTHPDNQHKVRNEDEETGFVPAYYVIIKEEVSGRSKNRLQKINIINTVNPMSTFF